MQRPITNSSTQACIRGGRVVLEPIADLLRVGEPRRVVRRKQYH